MADKRGARKMWEWLRKGRGKKAADLREKTERQEQLELLEELKTAKQEWENAQRFFEYATADEDQIDYAIFAIAAAEKRYEMLIRKAKRSPARWTLQRGI